MVGWRENELSIRPLRMEGLMSKSSFSKSPKFFASCIALAFICVLSVKGQSASNEIGSAPKVVRVAGELRLGKTINVEVQNLSSWSANHETRDLVPYLNGRPLHGVTP